MHVCRTGFVCGIVGMHAQVCRTECGTCEFACVCVRVCACTSQPTTSRRLYCLLDFDMDAWCLLVGTRNQFDLCLDRGG